MSRQESVGSIVGKILIGAAAVMAVVIIGRLIAVTVVFNQIERVQEVALRPAYRLQAEQEARAQATRENEIRERELMKGVHAEVRRQEEARRHIDMRPQETEASYIETNKAWKRWYKPLEGCEVVSDANMMACANHHVRERAKFDRLVAEGRIH